MPATTTRGPQSSQGLTLDTREAPVPATITVGGRQYDPADLIAAIEAIEAKRLAEQAVAAAQAELAAMYPPGYPKVLYNPKFPFESIQAPDSNNHRIEFKRGCLEVSDPEIEAWVRMACPGRIYEADMATEKVCTRCDRFRTKSTDAWQIHMEGHTP